MSLYPITFEPSFHYRIWGGNKLKNFGKPITENNIGESWEISTVPGFVSIVSNGFLKGKDLNYLINNYKEELLGTKVFDKYGEEFPLLIKFLDSSTPLSVQVHPDDDYAKKHHNSFGKSEMWYILGTEEKSEIILGFEKGIDSEKFSNSIKTGKIESILRKVYPKKDDVIYIPSRRVHALGKGMLVAEIQQTSDVTYRIYDYDRIDKDGKKRELHLQQAKEVADFSFIEKPIIQYDKNASESILVESPYFCTSKKIISEEKSIEISSKSFHIYICIEGKCVINYNNDQIKINKGNTVLIPASLKNINIIPEERTVLLDTYII